MYATLLAAANFGLSLLRTNSRFAEAKTFAAAQLPMARQKYGAHNITMTLIEVLAGASLMDPDATEGDLREAEALFEESFRMSRQILGAAHPETKTKQNTLSQIRKKLADPDRYTGVVCTTATY